MGAPLKAMILAAGLGTRMRPLTLKTPKPLLPLNGKPLIEYHVQRLVEAGFVDIVINHAWLGEQIEEYLGNGSQYGANIQYSAEGDPLETAGGIRQALPLLVEDSCEQFVVVNGDVFTNYPFAQLKDLNPKGSYLVLVPNPEHNPTGDFVLENDQVISEGADRYTFSGISVLSADMFHHLSAGEPASLAPILRSEIDKGCVSGELFTGYWADVGTPQRLKEIEFLLKEQQIDGL